MKLSANQKFFSTTAAMSVLLLTAACGGGSSDGGATTPTSAATTGGSTSAASYKDGSYDGKGSYPNPAGSSTVEVKLTIKDNKIAALKLIPEATNPTSKGYEAEFAGGIASETVGKNIDSLNVSKVAGSSLTVQGFTKAMDSIKADAKA